MLLWLVSPVSRGSLGSSLLYRKVVHPNLLRREEDIDRWLGRLREQSYNAAIKFGSRAFQYVTNIVMQTAIKVINRLRCFSDNNKKAAAATTIRNTVQMVR